MPRPGIRYNKKKTRWVTPDFGGGSHSKRLQPKHRSLFGKRKKKKKQ